MSGGSGVIYGIRLLEVLKKIGGIETYGVITPAANITIKAETDYSSEYVDKLFTKTFRFNDISASIASGSFLFESMVVIPCSMHTLGAIASGVADNLLTRAAEVTMKERRTLILVPLETPLTLIHLENMVRVAQSGAIVMPAMPAFYNRPRTLDDAINHLVGKVLDLLKVENDILKRWQGIKS